MGRIIKLKPDYKKENEQSLLDLIFNGKPYKFKFFNKEITLISKDYELRKRNEFFNEYFDRFVEGLLDINIGLEFNPNFMIDKYNNLSEEAKKKVIDECSLEYTYNGLLKYKTFYDLIEKYSFENKKSVNIKNFHNKNDIA